MIKQFEIPNDQHVFNYYPPKNKYIGILSIPHSGEKIPAQFREFLTDNEAAIAEDVDYRVNELVDIEKLTEAGIAVIVANIHRTCIDLNRSSDLCLLNWKKNSKGIPLVLKEPDKDTATLFIQKFYAPYYEMLKAMIDELHHTRKKVSFIDLHSMPSEATEYHMKANPHQKKERPDFCVSDIEGLSCEKAFIDFVCENLKQSYPVVTQNDPYFGGHITRHVNATFAFTNNIQIEIKRGIYMDEEKKVLVPELVEKLKPVLTECLVKTFEKFNR